MEEFTISPGQYLIATCSLTMCTALAGYHAKQDGKTGLAWINRFTCLIWAGMSLNTAIQAY